MPPAAAQGRSPNKKKDALKAQPFFIFVVPVLFFHSGSMEPVYEIVLK